jgi:uncharacterized protein
MTTPVKATLSATEVRTMKSRRTGREYRISVALPNSYGSKPRRRYPTIYLTDANWFFGIVTDLTRMMSRGPGLPEAIVVGIGYPVDDDGPLDAAFMLINKSRLQDLTPVVDRKMEDEIARANQVNVKTGGAAKFLGFIQTELVPLIEADYRAKSVGRILMGHSLGGLFSIYALLHQPKLFNGYVAVDPSLFYRDKSIFDLERRFARTHTTLPVKLYLGIGEMEKEHPPSEMVSNQIQFAAHLESRHYTGFTMTQQIHVDCDHGAVIGPGFQAGLRAVMS